MKTTFIRCLWFVILIFLFFCRADTSIAADDTSPPTLPNLSRVADTLDAPPVMNVLLGHSLVELEKSTYRDIKALAKSGQIQHRGDAAGSEYWLCYTTQPTAQNERIWFTSGEISGGIVIDGFAARIVKNHEKITSECPLLPNNLRPVRFAGTGLWLNSDPHELEKQLGRPSGKAGDWWIYSYFAKISNISGDYDIISWIAFEIDQGIVVSLYEYQLHET